MSDGKIIIDTSLDNKGFEKGSASLINAIENLEKAMQAIGLSMGQSLNLANNYLKQIAENSTVIVSKMTTTAQEATTAQQALTNATNQTAEAQARAQTETRKQTQAAQEQANAANQTAQAQTTQTQAAQQNAAAQREATESEKENLVVLGEIDLMSTETAKNIGNLAYNSSKLKTAFDLLGGGIKKAFNSLKDFAVKGVKAIGSGIVKMVKDLGRFNSTAKKSAISTNSLVRQLGSLKRMFVSRIKRTFISMLFTDVTNAIKSLVLFDAAFDASISNIKNSIKQLGGNLSVTLSNLIIAMEPIITELVSLLNKAVVYLNSFFAMLKGETTVTTATKSTKKYSSSIEKAADAQEKLNRSVMGFDKLNKLSAENSKSGSGATNEDIDPAQFKKVDISNILPNNLKKYFETLKSNIQQGDWAGVGATLANGFNSAIALARARMQTIDTKTWALNIVNGLNGFIKNTDWASFGQFLGEGINKVLDFCYTAVHNFDFKEAGKALATSVNNLFSTIDWQELGKLVNESALGVLTFLRTTIEEFDWEALATNIKDFLTQLDWEKVCRELVNVIVKAFLGLATIVIRLLPTLLKIGIDIIKGLKDGVLQALDDISTWLADNIIAPVVEWFNENKDALKQAGEDLINGLLNGLKSGWDGITGWVKKQTDSLVDDFKVAWGINSPSKVMAKIGGYLDAGLQQGIEGGEKDVIKTVKNLAETVTDKTKLSPEVDVTAKTDILTTGLETALKGFEGVAEKFAAFSSIIKENGGLQVPAIAMGTVAPYKTKIGSESPGVDMEESNKLLTMIYNLISERAGVSTSDGVINVYLGNEKIDSLLLSAQNRLNRRTGGRV